MSVVFLRSVSHVYPLVRNVRCLPSSWKLSGSDTISYCFPIQDFTGIRVSYYISFMSFLRFLIQVKGRGRGWGVCELVINLTLCDILLILKIYRSVIMEWSSVK